MPSLSIPTKVYQDDFSPARGNALQACVASIFGMPLNDVPNFIAMPEGYEAAIKRFYLKQKKDGECIKIIIDGSCNSNIPKEYNNMFCMLRGKSPRGDFGHVVVAKYICHEKFDMVHDPKPDETFLDTKEAYGWCLFFS
mmetsp:Transcript_6084/g.6822  ORF Transcript_6084/g.6822 Transcript_6084/m.6822 type:complete len:139 (+) Transcript_6084:199-615(+)